MQPDLEDFTLRIIPENTNNTHNTYFGRLLFNSIFHSRDINFPIRHFILRHLVDIEEDEQYEEETSNNPNFMQEKNMNFRLYPFYINWKKIEHNESGYYRIFLKYGYLGRMQNIVVAMPDITEIELDEDFSFLVIGCDGIFDVLSNEQILECIKIVIKEKKIDNFKNVNISELCGDIADMIIYLYKG